MAVYTQSLLRPAEGVGRDEKRQLLESLRMRKTRTSHQMYFIFLPTGAEIPLAVAATSNHIDSPSGSQTFFCYGFLCKAKTATPNSS